MAISTTQLVDELAARTGLPKSQARRVLSAVFETIGSHLEAGQRVQVSSFGTFEVRDRAERQGVNPQTRERVTIAASKSVGFRAATGLKSRLTGENV